MILTDNQIFLTMADKYYYESKQSDIRSFINNKLENEDISFTIEMSKSQKYQSIIMFKDSSIIIKDNKGVLNIMNTSMKARFEIDNIFKSYVEFNLRKKPNVGKMFSEIIEKTPYHMAHCLEAMKTFTNNENILKSNDFDILLYKNCTFEKIDDEMNQTINMHKFEQYAHSITSKKYLELYDSSTYGYLKELYDSKISASFLQDNIGKKMAAFHNTDELNTALFKLMTTLNSFTPEIVKMKAESINAEIIFNVDNIMALKIKTFEQSSVLGSSSWCISRQETYFNSYTSNNNHQYFIFDFNKEYKDNESMIGITLREDGGYNTAHKKNDDLYRMDHILKPVQLRILKHDQDSYPNMDEHLKLFMNEIIKDNPVLTKNNSSLKIS